MRSPAGSSRSRRSKSPGEPRARRADPRPEPFRDDARRDELVPDRRGRGQGDRDRSGARDPRARRADRPDGRARASLRIEAILVTHGHPDHAPGAAPLAARTGAAVYAHPAARVPVRPGARRRRDAAHRRRLRSARSTAPGHAPRPPRLRSRSRARAVHRRRRRGARHDLDRAAGRRDARVSSNARAAARTRAGRRGASTAGTATRSTRRSRRSRNICATAKAREAAIARRARASGRARSPSSSRASMPRRRARSGARPRARSSRT